MHLGFRHSYLSMFENFPAQNLRQNLRQKHNVKIFSRASSRARIHGKMVAHNHLGNPHSFLLWYYGVTPYRGGQ